MVVIPHPQGLFKPVFRGVIDEGAQVRRGGLGADLLATFDGGRGVETAAVGDFPVGQRSLLGEFLEEFTDAAFGSEQGVLVLVARVHRG